MLSQISDAQQGMSEGNIFGINFSSNLSLQIIRDVQIVTSRHFKIMVKLLLRSKTWSLSAMAVLTILAYHNLLRIYYVSKLNGSRKNLPPLTRREAEEGGFAYVFYATSIPYACSALVNIQQLQNLGSTVPIHVLVSDQVPQTYMKAFEVANATTHLEEIQKLPLYQNVYYEDCLMKLLAFKMHTLDPALKRVLLFDSDQLILKHFDYLFSDIPLVDLAAPRAYWLEDSEEKAVFSSAFMLISLSNRLWDKVNKTMQNVKNLGRAEDRVDMEILNEELGDTATILSGEYVTLNSHWEDWGIPNWYHPKDVQNASHTQQRNDAKKDTKLGRPTNLNEDLESLSSERARMAHSEDSEIYKQLVELYKYVPIIHFTALGKPWTYSVDEVTERRQEAHPAFADQFSRWRKIAEEVCPESHLLLAPPVNEISEENPVAGYPREDEAN